MNNNFEIDSLLFFHHMNLSRIDICLFGKKKRKKKKSITRKTSNHEKLLLKIVIHDYGHKI